MRNLLLKGDFLLQVWFFCLVLKCATMWRNGRDVSLNVYSDVRADTSFISFESERENRPLLCACVENRSCHVNNCGPMEPCIRWLSLIHI